MEEDEDADDGAMLYRVHYDDGDKEWLDLLHRKFKRVPQKALRLKVGSRVSVYDEEEDKFFPGTVTKIQPESNKPHRVKYDDQDRNKEWLNLAVHPFLDIEKPSHAAPDATVNSNTLKKRKKEFMKEDPNSYKTRKNGHALRVEESRRRPTVKEEQEEEGLKTKQATTACHEACGICNAVAKRPRATQCHHIFCKRCITFNEEYKKTSRCPLCPQVAGSAEGLVKYEPDHVSFKPVEALDRTTAEVVHSYSSAAVASRAVSVPPASIITACQSKRRDDREVHGYYWRFQGCTDRILRVGEGVKDGVAIEQVDLNTGKVIEVFASGRKAHEKTGVGRVVIRRVLERRGKANGGGFFWRYQGETHGPWPDPEPVCKTAVEQLDFETGDMLKSFASLADAKRAMGMKPNSGHIRDVCDGNGRATAGSFFWRWKGSDAQPNHMMGVHKVIQIRKGKCGEVVKEFRTSRDAQAYFGYQCCWSKLCRYARDKEFAMGHHWRYRMLREKATAQEEVLGKRLSIRQPAGSEFEWLEGKINAFNSQAGKFEILYDSGETIHCRLEDIQYKWKNDSGQKPVEQLDLKTGQVLASFQSLSEASASLDPPCHPTRIAAVCHGRVRAAHGFFWRFQGSSNQPRKIKGRRKIEQLCLKTGRVLGTFDTITAAGKAVGITTPGISYCCNGRNSSKSAGGFGWRFSNEDEDH
ncbi:expressed unknown protein [Seminavis robusta]|uniref:RING-type domain-containing protein n=1 Tax=Seminavis robusta TaxID=568900 RepID=A0A9N8H996_9STRA|nr:expressed unknown protein [Seminavis robusta]|eukprot:Sro184_g079870.1 n/a (696) ;mRNA; f:27337-29424